jgi:type IV pilus assembly protein PilZ
MTPKSADKITEEKREHIRAPIELKVEYKKMNTFFADYTKNISKGGTFIKTDKPLPVGTEFLFRLVIPGLADPVEIKGTVVWINASGAVSHPEVEELGMGIRFVYRDDAHRRGFESMVEKMMRDSLGDLLFNKLMARAAAENKSS